MNKLAVILGIIVGLSGLVNAAATIDFDDSSTQEHIIGGGVYQLVTTTATDGDVVINSSSGLYQYEPGNFGVYNALGLVSEAQTYDGDFDLTQVDFMGLGTVPAASLEINGIGRNELGQTVDLGTVEVDLSGGMVTQYFGWDNVVEVIFTPKDAFGNLPAYFLMDNLVINANDDPQYAPAVVPVPSAFLLASGGTLLVGFLRRRK